MKRRYQIDSNERCKNSDNWPAKRIPTSDDLSHDRGRRSAAEGVGHLMREAGLALMSLVMEEEVRHLAGERHEQHPRGALTAGGRKPVTAWWTGRGADQRTRLRTQENREQRLGSYEMFQRSGPMEHAVWDKLMRGLSTRNYGAVVKDFREAYGVEKSAVSDTSSPPAGRSCRS